MASTLENLIRQVVGIEDTKAGGIISQWTEFQKRGYKTNRYYPTMDKDELSGPRGNMFRPDEQVKSLSGEICNTPSPTSRRVGTLVQLIR